MSTLLERQIMALLRRQFSRPLSPRRLRSPVPGGRDTVVPRVWGPPVWWVGPGDTTLRIEPGLLCLPSVRADIEYPVLMERPTWLATWAGGSGVAVPESDPARSTLLLGELAAAPELEPPYDWPDGADYEGLLYSSAAAMQRVLDTSVPATRLRYPATAYTGWAQLWAEACLASGRLLSDRVPPGCTTAPGALGLVWSDTDPATGVPTAWAIDVDSVGLWAWEMECSDLTLPTLAALAAGDYTGDAAHLAWLYVLADLVPVGGQDAEPQIVLSESAIADAYAAGGPFAMSGWHWHPYSAGAQPIARSVHGDVADPGPDAAFECYEVAVEVVPAPAGGTCTASVTADTAARWRPVWGTNRLHVGAPDALQLIRCASVDQSDCAASAPVLGLWDGAGAWHVLRHYRVAVDEDASVVDTDYPCTCDGAGSSTAYTGALQYRTGGYGLDGPPPGAVIGSGQETVYSGGITGGAWDDWATRNADWLTVNWISGEALGGCGAHFSDAAYPAVESVYGYYTWARTQMGEAFVERDIRAWDSRDSMAAWVYVPDLPAALWRHRVDTATGLASEVRTWARQVVYAQEAKRSILPYPSYWDPPKWQHVFGSTVGGEAVHCLGNLGVSGGQSLLASDSTLRSVATSSHSGVITAAAECWIAGATPASDPDAPGWGGLYVGDGSELVQLVLDAALSARGSGIWRAEPGGVLATDSGIDAGALAQARAWAGG